MKQFLVSLAFVSLLTACGSSEAGDPPPAKEPSLGKPVESELPPLLVPANARSLGTDAGLSTYALADGIDGQDVVDWYRANMPPEADVEDLTYVARQTDLPDGSLVSWGWCDSDYSPVSLSVGSAESIDGGGTLIRIDVLAMDYSELCFDLQYEQEEE